MILFLDLESELGVIPVNDANRSEIFNDPGHQVDVKVLVELRPPSDYAVHPIKDLSAWLPISVLLKVIHESLDATESRRTSTFSTAEYAAEVGLWWIRRKILCFHVTFEEELPAELNALTEDQDSSVVTFLLIFIDNHAALESTLLALPITIGAVHATRPLSFFQGLFEVANLKSPCTFAKAGELIALPR